MIRQKCSVTLAVTILVAIAFDFVVFAAQTEDEAAVAGQKWLSLVDERKYEESWKEASAMFRDAVSLQQWIAALKTSRDPLGAVDSRTRTRIEFVKSLREAPDGDYAIIHYSTSFSGKSSTERLTLVKQDGKWQMAAYGIY